MLLLIGAIIGLVMGLTGAGGALVAIPLFMHFLGMSLKEASVYSLLAVVIASLSNFYYQRKHAHLKLALIFVISSTAGSFLSQPYKNILPEIGIAILLTLVALYSLYGVWKESAIKMGGNKTPHLLFTILIGLALGVLTTFTGLGGGVLMLPILLSLYKLPQNQAVATSLVVVGLSSLSSFIIQVSRGLSLKIDEQILLLVIGIFVVSYFLKILMTKFPESFIKKTRKLVFTVVVILALAKIFQ